MNKTRLAFTLVELLIVIAIIGLLVQLALPAVQMAHESARASSCQNNLRQQALAFSLHHDTHQYYPSGGWGFYWAPDPDRGTGKEQPGSWGYSILPQIEETPLYELGAGSNQQQKRIANKQRFETPVNVYYCPSRRLPRAYRVHPAVPYVLQPNGCDPLEVSGRIDYAANGGGKGFISWKSGPGSYQAAKTYSFFDPENGHGIIFPRSEINLAQIVDGTTHTYLVGEKYLNRLEYKSGTSFGDDQGPFQSDDRDSIRFAGGESAAPAQDRNEDRTHGFGSAHPSGFFMAFCDGSVHRIDYTIDRNLHQQQANRSD